MTMSRLCLQSRNALESSRTGGRDDDDDAVFSHSRLATRITFRWRYSDKRVQAVCRTSSLAPPKFLRDPDKGT